MSLQNCEANIRHLLDIAKDDAEDIDKAFIELQKRQTHLCYLSVLTHLVSPLDINVRPFLRKKYEKALLFCRIIPLLLVVIQILRVWKVKYEICGLKREAKRRIQSVVDTLYGDEKKTELNGENGSDESDEVKPKPKWTETKLPTSNLFYESFVGILQLISFYLIFRKPKPIQPDYDIPFDTAQLFALNRGIFSDFKFGDLQSKFETFKRSFTDKVTQIRNLISTLQQKSDNDKNRAYVVPNLSAKVSTETWRKMKPYGEKIDTNANDIIQYCKHWSPLMSLYSNLFSLQEKDDLFNRMWQFVQAGTNLSKAAKSFFDSAEKRANGQTPKRNVEVVVNLIKQMKTFAQNAAKFQKRACKISTTPKMIQDFKDIVKQIKSYSSTEQFDLPNAKNEVTQNRNAIEKIWKASFLNKYFWNYPIENNWLDDWISSAETISGVLDQNSLPIFKEGVEAMTDAIRLASEEREDSKVLVAAKNIGTDVLKMYKEALVLEGESRERNQISTESIVPIQWKLRGVFKDAEKIAEVLQIDVSLDEASQRAEWFFCIRKMDIYQWAVVFGGIGVDVLFFYWSWKEKKVSHPFSNSLRKIRGKIINDFRDIFK